MTDVGMCTVALRRAANREDRGMERMSRRRQLMRLRDLQREAEEERSRRPFLRVLDELDETVTWASLPGQVVEASS
jgi:transcription initiation factor TFIIIB Brf1 subunit/transcription initiation factor TFIIB